MSTVIETLGEYETYLTYDRRIKASTLRKINLSLRYFTSMYGTKETSELRASDLYIFFERLKNQKCARHRNAERSLLGDAFVQKVMSHIKTYVRRLGNS